MISLSRFTERGVVGKDILLGDTISFGVRLEINDIFRGEVGEVA